MNGLAIFDIDGTLIDDRVPEGGSDVHFLAAFRPLFGAKVGPDWSDWTSYRSSTSAGIFRELCERHLGRSPTTADTRTVKTALAAAFAAPDAPPLVPVPGGDTILPRLVATGEWAVAIVTGNWREEAEAKLAAAGIDRAGAPIFCSDDAEERPGILRRCLDDCGRDRFARIVYVGDRPWDLAAADVHGLGFVRVKLDAAKDGFPAGRVLPTVDGFEELAAVRRALAG